MKGTRFVTAAVLCAAVCAPALAQAGVATDKLADCLVRSSTQEDRAAMAVWVFAAISAHPAAADLAHISSDKRDEANKHYAEAVLRLSTVTCRAEAISAIKADGRPGVVAAFNRLGSAAVEGLFANPQVQKEMSGVGKYFDTPALRQMLAEAGDAYDKK